MKIHTELIANIIIFEDGMYFNGVKGKMVRKTKHFKDAKIINTLSSRDRQYLKDYKYEIKQVKITIEEVNLG